MEHPIVSSQLNVLLSHTDFFILVLLIMKNYLLLY